MTQQSESALNNVLIDMACSFLQYVAESSPWISVQEQSVGKQFLIIAARQRQDVSEMVSLLTEREHFVDFGSFPTEYTDQQFLALDTLIEKIRASQTLVLASISNGLASSNAEGDDEISELLKVIEVRQKDIATALEALQRELAEPNASA